MRRRRRFRSFAMRQRADQMTINTLIGQCNVDEYQGIQTRIQSGQAKERRRARRQAHVPPYDLHSRIFAWGQGGFSHQRPWAPIPQQRLMNVAAKDHRVVLVNENMTSQVCCAHGGYEEPVALIDHYVAQVNVNYSKCAHK